MPNFRVVGTMLMETKMETEIPVCEITYGEINVCSQTAINASFSIQQKHIHSEWLLQTIPGTDALLLCGFQLEGIRGAAGHALKVDISMPSLRLISNLLCSVQLQASSGQAGCANKL